MAWVIPDYELSYNNREEVLRLPVNPQSPPQFYTPVNNQNWNTTDVGTFKAIGYEGLESTTLEFWWPVQSYSFSLYEGYPSAAEVLGMLKRWKSSRRPIRLIVTGLVNEAYAIEGVTYSQEIATGDIIISLELEQYRFAESANPQTGNSYRPNTSVADTLVMFVGLEYGQTLCELADKYLGDSDRYMEIAEANGIKDVGHPWSETEGKMHTIEIVCESGTPGYEEMKQQVEAGVGVG